MARFISVFSPGNDSRAVCPALPCDLHPRNPLGAKMNPQESRCHDEIEDIGRADPGEDCTIKERLDDLEEWISTYFERLCEQLNHIEADVKLIRAKDLVIQVQRIDGSGDETVSFAPVIPANGFIGQVAALTPGQIVIALVERPGAS